MHYSLLVLTLLFTVLPLTAQTDVPLQQREGERHRSDADRYFESLHVTPPDMNWKAVNEEVREARLQRLVKRAEGVQADTPTVRGTWREVGSSNQAGRVMTMEFDKASGRLWAAGAGGTVWKGKIDGTEWTCLTDAKRINDPVLLKHVVLSSGVERLIAVSANARCFYLDGEGLAWKQSDGLTEMQRWGWFTDAVTFTREDGSIEIVAIGVEWDYGTAWRSRNVVYRSVDTGVSFQRVKWFDGSARAVWTPGDECYVIHGDTISTVNEDGTFTTQHVQTGLWNASNVRSVIMAGPFTSYVGLALTSGDSTTFWVSQDGALTSWEQRGTIKVSPFDAQSFEIDPNSYAWMFGGVEVHRSLDEGYTFTPINRWGEYYGAPATKLHADIPQIMSWNFGESDDPTFIATDGGLYVSRDGGTTVQNLSLKGLNISQYYSSYTSRDNVDVVSVGSQDQGYQRSRVDSGGVRAFQQMISGDYSSMVSGDGGQSLFCVYPGFTMYVPAAEDGWGPHMLDFPHKGHMWLPPLTTGPTNPQQAWLGGGTRSTGAKVYTYTFEQVKLSIDSLAHDFGEGQDAVNITALMLAPSNDNIGYVVASHGVVWRTLDRGASWQKFARPDKLNGHYFSGNALTADSRDAYRIYIGGSGYDGPAVYASVDGAATWTPLNGLPPCLVLSLAVSADGRYIAAATDVGAYMYDTLAQSWTDITAQGAPDQTYWHVDYVAPLDVFRFCTYGRGIFDYKVGEVTGVSPSAQVGLRVGLRGGLRVGLRGGLRGGQSAGVDVESDQERVGRLVWYTVDGRKVYEQKVSLREGTTWYERPQQAEGATTVVLITDDGHIAAGVTTR